MYCSDSEGTMAGHTPCRSIRTASFAWRDLAFRPSNGRTALLGRGPGDARAFPALRHNPSYPTRTDHSHLNP